MMQTPAQAQIFYDCTLLNFFKNEGSLSQTLPLAREKFSCASGSDRQRDYSLSFVFL